MSFGLGFYVESAEDLMIHDNTAVANYHKIGRESGV